MTESRKKKSRNQTKAKYRGGRNVGRKLGKTLGKKKLSMSNKKKKFK